MIRTDVVSLSVIKAAAYRQKLPAGGSGIVILCANASQPGIASISKTSGEPIPTANTPKDLYPLEAFQEAITLTAGLPYNKRGNARLNGEAVIDEPAPAAEEETEEEALVDSAEYQKIVEKYTDKNGKLSYELLNRDLIKVAHSSSKVRKMLEDGESLEAIRLYTVGAKFRNITGNHNLTDAQVLKMAELLDEVSPKGVFKEFNDEIRRRQTRK